MTLDLVIITVVVALVFAAFLRNWASPDIVAMTGFVVVVATGIIGPQEMLSVFSNSAPVTIGAMFILSAALERTGVIDRMAQVFARVAGNSELRALLMLMMTGAVLSAFVNNTPVVVVFLPIVLGMARTSGLKASRLLIPLSFASMLGGTCTLVGTSTNLLVDGVAQLAGQRPFGMFEISVFGLIHGAVGMVYLLTIGRRLLPSRETLSTLIDVSEGREFLLQATISEGSPLVAARYADTPLAKIKQVRVIEVSRDGSRLSTPLDQLQFRVGDHLLFKTATSGVSDLREVPGIAFQGTDRKELGLEHVEVQKARLMEGIIGPQSSMVGRTLAEMNFRQKYGAIILAVHRQGHNLREHFERLRLTFGDTLLVEGPVDGIKRLMEERDFVSLSEPKQQSFRRSRAPLAMVVIAAVVGLAAFNITPIATAAIIGALVVVVLRCLDVAEAYDAVDWKILFLIFGMLGLGLAIEKTGAAALLAHGLLGLIGQFGPHVVLSAVYALTVVITAFISNNATAVLLTPLVLSVAGELGVDGRPFVVAVMFGASACFATPIGYQTNTYVYGAGGYKFSDFPRVGILLNVILWAVATWLIPAFWPFAPALVP